MSAENEAAASGREQVIPNIWRGLLWREWLAHKNLVLWALCAWLVGGWVLMIFYHPGWIIGAGVLYAMIAGQAFGGGDTIAGTEEFTASLPPLRGQQYLARLVLACGTTLAFTGLGALAIVFDLPQHLWGLVVESGFTEPFPPCDSPWLYGLAVGAPFLTLALTFGIAATTKTRGLAVAAPIVGVIGAGLVVWITLGAEQVLWERLTGLIALPVPLAIGAMVLLYGYGRYLRKEAVARPGGAGRMSAIVIVVIVVVVALLLMLIMWVNVGSAPAPRAPPARAFSVDSTHPAPPDVGTVTKSRSAPSATTAPARTEKTDKGDD